MNESLLQVENLQLHYRTEAGILQAVDQISFELLAGQALAVLGESGCGKSSIARALVRLIPRNTKLYAGRILWRGIDIMRYTEEQLRREIRWSQISIVMSGINSLNPVLRVADQIIEPLQIHHGIFGTEAHKRAEDVLQLVGIPKDFMHRYAHELSGGMRQRVGLAMALVLQPQLVIMDEPTSALDVLTQASIMNALKHIKHKQNTAFIFITHDIATASELADRVAVMYAGQIVEIGNAANFFTQPLHPYSQALMASVPRLRAESKPQGIPGNPPNLLNPPMGCRFAPRCSRCMDKCTQLAPPFNGSNGSQVKCWLYQ